MMIAQTESTARRHKLRKIAAAARVIATAGILLVLGYQGFLLLQPDLMLSSLNRAVWPIDLSSRNLSPSTAMKILVWLITAVPSVLFVAAMLNVRTLFGLLSRGSLFDREISHLLRRIGQIAVAAAIAVFLARTLAVLAITMGSPGFPHFVIGISSEEITALVIGLLLLAFALVMQEVFLIEEENRGFI